MAFPKAQNIREKNSIILGIKLLFIIAFFEMIAMTILSYLEIQSPLLSGILDTAFLAFFSGISIWRLIIVPNTQKLEDKYSHTLNEVDQEISAIDRIAIISSTDLYGTITYANDKFCDISGYTREELNNTNHRILKSGVHPNSFYTEMWTTLASGKQWQGQLCNKKKNGDLYWVHAYNVPIFNKQNKIYKYVSFRFDITAEKNAETKLDLEKMKNIHLSRLSAIGEMAGGIAHEINNPLTIINGSLVMMMRRLQKEDQTDAISKTQEGLTKVQTQVNRMTKIILGLKNFSRAGDDNITEIVNTEKIFSTVIDLCLDKINRNNVRLEVNAGNYDFQCNSIQIEQVLVNLITNAVDAISLQEDKWIKLEAKVINHYLEISVSDSGLGVPKELLEKIMQPFFTTKEIGKGTGLGLSISHGIIKNHGGELIVDSECANTKFIIKIPINDESLMAIIELDEIVNNHLEWKNKFIANFSEPNAIELCSHAGSDRHCKVGKWIEQVNPRFKDNYHFNELKKSHTEFHNIAGQIVKNLQSGLELKLDSDYENISSKVVDSIYSFRKNIQDQKKAS